MSFANYQWSSGLIRFTTLTPANKRTLIDILANFSAGVAHWNTPVEFRTVAAFNHELVHYYQDMLTGLGHSDFIHYNKLMGDSNMYAQLLLMESKTLPFSTADPKYTDAISPYKAYYDMAHDKFKTYAPLFLYPNLCTPSADDRKKELQNYVTSKFGNQVSATNYEGLLVENLLESEAVATVHLDLMDLNQTEDQFGVYERNSAMVWPHKMSSLYSETIAIIMLFVKDAFDESTDPDTFYKSALHYLIFLVDLCSAYPPVEIIAHSKIAKAEFTPGIKFLRLLNSIHTLKKEDGEKFAQAWKENDSDEAEKILLTNCDITYPPTKQIYEAWWTVFKNMANQSDDVLIQLRLNACQNRVNSKSNSFNKKNLSQFLYHHPDIPINFLTVADGITTQAINEQTDKDFQDNMMIDLMKRGRDLKLIDLFYGSGELSCPLAEAHMCNITEKKCFSIKALDDVPTNQACRLNRSLSPFKTITP